MKKISVIVTVYNRMEHLRTFFQCMLKQTEQPYELIIADDGSSEKIEDFIGDLIPKAKFKIKHVYQQDLGFRKSKSLNNAVKVSQGDFLIFLDQDVIFGDRYIETIKKKSKKHRIHPFKVLWSNYEEKNKIMNIIENGGNYKEMLDKIDLKQKKDRKKQNFKDSIRTIKYRFKLRKKELTVGGASFALYKEDYIKVNGFDETFKGHGNEDLDFGFRLQKSDVFVAIINFEEAPIHLNHQKDPTAGSNEIQLKKMKEKPEILNSYAEYGYDNRLDKDEYIVRVITS